MWLLPQLIFSLAKSTSDNEFLCLHIFFLLFFLSSSSLLFSSSGRYRGFLPHPSFPLILLNNPPHVHKTDSLLCNAFSRPPNQPGDNCNCILSRPALTLPIPSPLPSLPQSHESLSAPALPPTPGPRRMRPSLLRRFLQVPACHSSLLCPHLPDPDKIRRQRNDFAPPV
jgi:hypothetical protein